MGTSGASFWGSVFGQTYQDGSALGYDRSKYQDEWMRLYREYMNPRTVGNFGTITDTTSSGTYTTDLSQYIYAFAPPGDAYKFLNETEKPKRFDAPDPRNIPSEEMGI